MPRNYQREKVTVSPGLRTVYYMLRKKSEQEESLCAAKTFGVPYRTLQRRIAYQSLVKGVPGPRGSLGLEYE